jgi:RecA-family ATPase
VQQENSDQRVQRDLQQILVGRRLGHVITEIGGVDEDGTEWEVERFEWDEALNGEVAWKLDVISHAGVDLSSVDLRTALYEHVEAEGYRYLFLDPLYMLVGGVDEKDSAQLKPILTWLTSLTNNLGCGVILTHHMSDKDGKKVDASALLGSTYIHGWYEAAIFVQRLTSGLVKFHVDALRHMGVTESFVLTGEGVGRWTYQANAQGKKDALGRDNTRKAAQVIRRSKVAELLEADPNVTDAEMAQRFGVSEKTIGRDRVAIAKQTSHDAVTANWNGKTES